MMKVSVSVTATPNLQAKIKEERKKNEIRKENSGRI